MDPFTQGVVGVSATQLLSSRKDKFIAAGLGVVSGMAADLDVLIKSSSDPLLALEYHRHFTHSLIFIPFGALLCALLVYYLFSSVRQSLGFARTYLFCLAGYATHAVLDACTTYGTQLFWPFSTTRVSWNNVSVVDPLFTIPLLILVLIAMFRRSTLMAFIAAAYAFGYLGLGAIQGQRAQTLAEQLAQSRGHETVNVGVKPSFGNIITWKSVYQHENRFYVDAIRVLVATRIIEGTSTEKLDVAKHFSWLDLESQQAKDIKRFSWFSQEHLALDPDNPMRIIDMRYSLLPNRADGMWGIVLKKDAADDEHVAWTTTRPNKDNVRENVALLWGMIVR